MSDIISDLEKIHEILTQVYNERNVKFWTDDNPESVLNEFEILGEIGCLRDRVDYILYFNSLYDSTSEKE